MKIIITDKYNYGKIDGLDALKPGFSGEAFIILSRMEQKLHGIIRSNGNRQIAKKFCSFSGIILGLDKNI